VFPFYGYYPYYPPAYTGTRLRPTGTTARALGITTRMCRAAPRRGYPCPPREARFESTAPRPLAAQSFHGKKSGQPAATPHSSQVVTRGRNHRCRLGRERLCGCVAYFSA
jgi:hypothetical protein